MLLLTASIVGTSNVLAASNSEVEKNNSFNQATEIKVNQKYQGILR